MKRTETVTYNKVQGIKRLRRKLLEMVDTDPKSVIMLVQAYIHPEYDDQQCLDYARTRLTELKNSFNTFTNNVSRIRSVTSNVPEDSEEPEEGSD